MFFFDKKITNYFRALLYFYFVYISISRLGNYIFCLGKKMSQFLGRKTFLGILGLYPGGTKHFENSLGGKHFSKKVIWIPIGFKRLGIRNAL